MKGPAEVAEKTGGLGELGRPVNRRSPLMIGLHAAFGVAVAYGLIQLFIHARSVLILSGGHPAAAAGGRVPPAGQELIPLVNPVFLVS